MSKNLTTVQLVLDGQYSMIAKRSAPSLPYRSGNLWLDTEVSNPTWLVLNEPNRNPIQTAVPRDRRMLIIGEPSPLCYWPSEYINQFGVILSPYRITGHQGLWIESHPGLPWFVGWDRRNKSVMPYEDLEALQPPKKQEAISVVVSRKVVQEGHRNRLRFLERLSAKLGDRLQIFGKGIREVDDKKDAILPYCYHLALENTVEPNYWTEKLADSFLGYALPLYSGCPNIGRWFGDDCLIRLDLTDHSRAVDLVETVLREKLYSKYLPSVQRARQQILEQENVFEVVSRAIQSCPLTSSKFVNETVFPLPKASLPSRLRREVHRVYRQLTCRVPKVA